MKKSCQATYILFVTEVDGLKRLPGDAFNQLLRNAETHEGNQSHQLICFFNGSFCSHD